MNLRKMIDGGGSLQLNLIAAQSKPAWKPQQDVIVRRRTARTGPTTSEIMVGKILAVGDKTASVSIQKPGGITERREVNLSDISPVTQSMRRRIKQFNPQYRRMA